MSETDVRSLRGVDPLLPLPWVLGNRVRVRLRWVLCFDPKPSEVDKHHKGRMLDHWVLLRDEQWLADRQDPPWDLRRAARLLV